MVGSQDKSEPFVMLRIRNTSADQVIFSIEPWGEEYAMPSLAVFEVKARERAGSTLLLEHSGNRITLWAAEVDTLVYEGEELGAGLWKRAVAPPTPPNKE